jgi:ATP-dependent RNA helicase RhlB
VTKYDHDALLSDLPRPKPRQRRHRTNTGRAGANRGNNRQGGGNNYRNAR